MARSRKAETEVLPQENAPDIFDEQIALRQQEQAAQQEPVPSAIPVQPAEQPVTGHIANPTARPRENGHAAAFRRKLPDTLTIPVGDLKVQLIDKGDNRAGIGIRVEFPEGRKPTDEEKEIIRRHIKGEEGQSTGFTWSGQIGMWQKDIVRRGEDSRDVPATRAVAIRLDAENRVKALAEDFKQLYTDPTGYAEKIRQQRDHAAQGQSLPD